MPCRLGHHPEDDSARSPRCDNEEGSSGSSEANERQTKLSPTNCRKSGNILTIPEEDEDHQRPPPEDEDMPVGRLRSQSAPSLKGLQSSVMAPKASAESELSWDMQQPPIGVSISQPLSLQGDSTDDAMMWELRNSTGSSRTLRTTTGSKKTSGGSRLTGSSALGRRFGGPRSATTSVRSQVATPPPRLTDYSGVEASDGESTCKRISECQEPLFKEENSETALVFHPLPLWEEGGEYNPFSKMLRRGKAFTSSWQTWSHPREREGDKSCWARLRNMRLASEYSRRKLLWDLLALFFVAHDAIFMPLQFVQVKGELARPLSLVAHVFWTLDLFVSLLTPYEKVDGTLESRLGSIAWRYGRTWLVPDLVLVIVSWAEASEQFFSHRQEKVVHLIQLLRLLRLCRLMRMRAILWFDTRLRSERLALWTSILQALSGVLLAAHFIACLWVGLGTAGGSGWVEMEGLADVSPWFLYAMAYHWSLTQFYGSMEIRPYGYAERVFAIGALICGFFMATAFVSNVTSSMTRLHILTSQQTSHLLLLKKYLKENSISRRLAARVQMNAKHAIAEHQKHIEEADVEMLQLVSEPLRVEVHLEIYAPLLEKHPLFGRMLDANVAAMRQVCHVAVSTMSVSKDDVLFSRGEVPTAPKMLFLAHGSLKYSTDGICFDEVLPGEWACEPVLWTTWVYHGMLIATAESRIVMVDAAAFQEIAGRIQTEDMSLTPYAKGFVQALNACVRSDLGSSMDTESLVEAVYPRPSPVGKEVTVASMALHRKLLGMRTRSSHKLSVASTFKDISSVVPCLSDDKVEDTHRLHPPDTHRRTSPSNAPSFAWASDSDTGPPPAS